MGGTRGIAPGCERPSGNIKRLRSSSLSQCGDAGGDTCRSDVNLRRVVPVGLGSRDQAEEVGAELVGRVDQSRRLLTNTVGLVLLLDLARDGTNVRKAIMEVDSAGFTGLRRARRAATRWPEGDRGKVEDCEREVRLPYPLEPATTAVVAA